MSSEQKLSNMMNVNEQNQNKVIQHETPYPVIQHKHCDVLFHKDRQQINLNRCVQKVFLSPFYGEFSIFDKQGRLLGKSKESKLSFLQDDLQTECAKVTYDVMKLQNEYKTLRNTFKVQDPGLYFNFAEVFIEFHNAYDLDNKRTFHYIPVFYNVTNVWKPSDKELMF